MTTSPDAAILAAYALWVEARDALHADPQQATQEQDEARYKAILEAEARVLSHRPATAQGLAVQHVVFTAWGQFEATQSRTFDFQSYVFAMAEVEPDQWTKENPPDTAF